jgi:hypothetical protein
MRNAIRKLLYMAAVALLCIAPSAFADNTLTLVNGNANYGMGGVYTSPYLVSVNGSPVLMICDDFLTNVSLGQSWSAGETPLTALSNESSPNSNVKFDHSGSPSPDANENAAQQMWDYATAAYLANELMTSPLAMANNFGNETAGEISFAIWGIFDTQLLDSAYQAGLSSGAEGKLTSVELTAASNFLAIARAATSGVTDFSTLPNVTIYTSNPQTGSGSSQEFLKVTVAEPPSPVFLGLNLLAMAGLILVVRRRFAGSVR